MSTPMQSRDSETYPNLQAMLARIEAEMAAGYLEVQSEGLSFRELVCVYAALLREGRDRVFGSIRSLFRLHLAH